MPNIGLPELAIILVIVLLLFGASRLPKLGKSVGESIKGFKDGLQEAKTDAPLEPAATAAASAQVPAAEQTGQVMTAAQPQEPQTSQS
jgi:sec-independent protein translocase protein TatA